MLDYEDVFDRWSDLTQGELWSLDTSDVHNVVEVGRDRIAAALAICDLYDMPTTPRNVSAAGRVIRRALTGGTP
jgi:hypothetical protein